MEARFPIVRHPDGNRSAPVLVSVPHYGTHPLPHVTREDLRNPHDFVPLVESAEFNYEDGILAGLRAAEVAVRAARRRPAKG